MGLVTLTEHLTHQDAPAPSTEIATVAPVQKAPVVAATATYYDRALIDPTPALHPGKLNFAHNTPLEAHFKAPFVQREAQVEPPAQPAEESLAALPTPDLKTALLETPVPVPMRRPSDLQRPRVPEAPQVASATVSRPVRSVAIAAAPPQPVNNPNFFERLFGIKPVAPPETTLGYASLENNLGRQGLTPSPSIDRLTAVYDISTQIVTMPNGERLEAHSGLGNMMDDPRYVNVRMRGATPPGTYSLTEREALFHGVRAIRLNPVGGSAAIYGRSGILAHTYMLGPNGDSNGCVSFKNYDRFLQAFLRGEVKRLVVTAGSKQDLLPRIVNNRTSRAEG